EGGRRTELEPPFAGCLHGAVERAWKPIEPRALAFDRLDKLTALCVRTRGCTQQREHEREKAAELSHECAPSAASVPPSAWSSHETCRSRSTDRCPRQLDQPVTREATRARMGCFGACALPRSQYQVPAELSPRARAWSARPATARSP